MASRGLSSTYRGRRFEASRAWRSIDHEPRDRGKAREHKYIERMDVERGGYINLLTRSIFFESELPRDHWPPEFHNPDQAKSQG
jgi:hypothetical protein